MFLIPGKTEKEDEINRSVEKIETRNYLIHPKMIMLTLIITAIASLFLAFSISYMYNRFQADNPPVQLPLMFYFNTLVLLFSSYCLHKAKGKFIAFEGKSFKNWILAAIIISLCFLALQFIAWGQLIRMNIHINELNSGSYIYLVSATHFVHIVGGLPFLIYFFLKVTKAIKDSLKHVHFFDERNNFRIFKMISYYWHFIDVLWIYIILFFTINYFL